MLSTYMSAYVKHEPLLRDRSPRIFSGHWGIALHLKIIVALLCDRHRFCIMHGGPVSQTKRKNSSWYVKDGNRCERLYRPINIQWYREHEVVHMMLITIKMVIPKNCRERSATHLDQSKYRGIIPLFGLFLIDGWFFFYFAFINATFPICAIVCTYHSWLLNCSEIVRIPKAFSFSQQ